MRYWGYPFFLVVLCGYLHADRESDIRQTTQNYIDAYNKRDAQALMRMWTDEGVYSMPKAGTSIQGKDNLTNAYHNLFKEDSKSQIQTQIKSITFPSANEAIEKGQATWTSPGKETVKTNFQIMFNKINNQWLIARISELDESEKKVTQYEHLKILEWMIGDWIDADEDSKVEISAAWDENKNFIMQKFNVWALDVLQFDGQQIIGWDPIKKEVHSWLFDSNGGYGEGTWSKKSESWVVEASFIMPNGKKGSALNVYSEIKPDSYTWQSTARAIGGELLPNVDPVTVEKKKTGAYKIE